MKNLDLNAFGVEEINEVQMSEIDGGIVFETMIAVNYLYVCALIGAYEMGYDAGKRG